MPRPRIKRNGHAGEWELVWSAAELSFGAVLLAATLGGFGSLFWLVVEVGRESAEHNGYWESRDVEIERRLDNLERRSR